MIMNGMQRAIHCCSSILPACSQTSPVPISYVKPVRKFSFHPKSTRAIINDDDHSTADSAATKAVDVDRSLALKRRASELSADLKGTSIFLVGINSSYKSSLGKMLADALRYCCFDSDNLVEEACGGKDAATSYIESDEEGFLGSETEVLKQLSSMGRLVVCAGNGAVKSSTNLALLRHGISIFIDVPLELVANELIRNKVQLSASDSFFCRDSSEILDQLTVLYSSARSGYSAADVKISFQSYQGDGKIGESKEDDGGGWEAILTLSLTVEKFREEHPGHEVPLMKTMFYGGPWRVMRGDVPAFINDKPKQQSD